MLSENRFLYIISTFIIYHLSIPFILIFVAVFSQTIIHGIPFQELNINDILYQSIFLFILLEIGGVFYPTIGWVLGYFMLCEPKFYGKAIAENRITTLWYWIINCTILFPLLPALIVSYYLPFKKNQVRKKREEREGEEEKKEEN